MGSIVVARTDAPRGDNTLILSNFGLDGMEGHRGAVSAERHRRMPLPVSPNFPAFVPYFHGDSSTRQEFGLTWEPEEPPTTPVVVRSLFTEARPVPEFVCVTASYVRGGADTIDICYRALSASVRDERSMNLARELAERASDDVRDLAAGAVHRIYASDRLAVDLGIGAGGNVAIVTGTSADPTRGTRMPAAEVPDLDGWTEQVVTADVRPAF